MESVGISIARDTIFAGIILRFGVFCRKKRILYRLCPSGQNSWTAVSAIGNRRISCLQALIEPSNHIKSDDLHTVIVRNLDLTLIILNNFNFGMTGGQYSVTTSTDAVADSEFLNQAEIPIDICGIAESTGATYVTRCSGLDKDLAEIIAHAIKHKSFSIIETLGMCTGRYAKKKSATLIWRTIPAAEQ